jgi:hypothetical protein
MTTLCSTNNKCLGGLMPLTHLKKGSGSGSSAFLNLRPLWPLHRPPSPAPCLSRPSKQWVSHWTLNSLSPVPAAVARALMADIANLRSEVEDPRSANELHSLVWDSLDLLLVTASYLKGLLATSATSAGPAAPAAAGSTEPAADRVAAAAGAAADSTVLSPSPEPAAGSESGQATPSPCAVQQCCVSCDLPRPPCRARGTGRGRLDGTGR